MRPGLAFLSQGTRNLNVEYIVRRLEMCADQHNRCQDCPDIGCGSNHEDCGRFHDCARCPGIGCVQWFDRDADVKGNKNIM